MERNYDLDPKYLNNMRRARLFNHEALMATAILWGQRSKDPSSQVGACFVNDRGRIISVGYNGAPNEWPDEEFPWGRDTQDGENLNNTKYPYVVHAEMNAILNYMGEGRDFENSTVYVTLFPCPECAKFMVQRGIKKVVYLSDKYNLKDEEYEEKYNKDGNVAAKRIFTNCGVEFIPFDKVNEQGLEEVDVSLKPDEGIKMIRSRKKGRN